IYGIGSTLYTSTGPTVVFYGFANIGALPVMIVFLSDGSVVQVATTPGAITAILAPNTITSPSVTTTGMTQWGSQYVLIINQKASGNGYYVWDGTSVYQAGTITPIVTLTAAGSGYTSAPTATVSGGTGTGIVLVAHITPTGTVTSITVTNGGDYGDGSS